MYITQEISKVYFKLVTLKFAVDTKKTETATVNITLASKNIEMATVKTAVT